MPESSPQILTLKIILLDYKPEIWRRFQIKNDMTLGKLHDVIQIVMGWTDSHLHDFEQGKKRYSKPDPEEEMISGITSINEDDIGVGEVLKREKQTILYTYDFGDHWQHEIVLESVTAPDSKQFYPNCIEGARACPHEDCGGTWGYEGMLEALADPTHEEHESYLEWTGGGYDADKFDLKGVNKVLKDFKNYKSGWDDYYG